MDRFKEPSTYAAIAASLAPFAATSPYVAGAAVLFGAVGVVLRENSK